jgi:hypothetical protein
LTENNIEKKKEINWLEKIHDLPIEIRNSPPHYLNIKLLKSTIKSCIAEDEDAKDLEEIINGFRIVSKLERLKIYKNGDDKVKTSLKRLYNTIRIHYDVNFRKLNICFSIANEIEEKIYESFGKKEEIDGQFLIEKIDLIYENLFFLTDKRKILDELIQYVKRGIEENRFIPSSVILIKLGELDLIYAFNFWKNEY